VHILKCLLDGRHAGSRHSVLPYSAFHPDQPVGNASLLLWQNTPITGFESVIQEREILETIMIASSENILFLPVSGNVRAGVSMHLFVLLSIICWTLAAETSVEIRNVGCQVHWWQNKFGAKKYGFAFISLHTRCIWPIQPPQNLMYEICTWPTLRIITVRNSYCVINGP